MKKATKVEIINNFKLAEPRVEISTDNEIGSVLKKSQEKYRILFEKLNDAVFLVDSETGLIHDANKQSEVLLGMPTEAIIGMHYTPVHPVDELGNVKKLFQKYAETDKSLTSEEIFAQNRDGRQIPVEISTSVFESDGKKFILGVLRDINERKWVEEQNKTIIRTAFDGFWMLDIQGRLYKSGVERRVLQ